MSMLRDLPNISTVTEQKLIEAGIDTPQKLMEEGSKGAFLKIRLKDPTACVNMLCGLEGAIRKIRWHHLPDEVKADLKAFFKSL